MPSTVFCNIWILTGSATVPALPHKVLYWCSCSHQCMMNLVGLKQLGFSGHHWSVPKVKHIAHLRSSTLLTPCASVVTVNTHCQLSHYSIFFIIGKLTKGSWQLPLLKSCIGSLGACLVCHWDRGYGLDVGVCNLLQSEILLVMWCVSCMICNFGNAVFEFGWMLETLRNVSLSDELSCTNGGAVQSEYTNGMFRIKVEIRALSMIQIEAMIAVCASL